MNRLFYGDNLEVLKSSIVGDESIDLIYIDPPFNSNRDYNMLFETIDMSDSTAQRQAFADTWTNVGYVDEMNEIMELSLDMYRFLKMLDQMDVSKGVVSYLTTLGLRVYYMHKKLKNTGCFYLHCAPSMSHYIKIVCDLIFGKNNFRNEIIWKRTLGHHLSTKSFDVMTDSIFFYTKSDNYTFNSQYRQLSDVEIKKKFSYVEEETGRRFTHEKLEQSSNAHSKDEVRVINGKTITTELGWRWAQKTFDERLAENPHLIYWTSEGRPRYKRYADEYKGQKIGALWDDIGAISSNAKERLHYPTQKPEALLERIINTSTKEGDLVVDFFCGCGTAVVAAQNLNRRWIGVDISHLAVRLILDRLLEPYKNKPIERKNIARNIDINGFPKDIATAKDLATKTDKGRFKFQDWIVEIMLGGVLNPKKVADGGYDGYITFKKGNGEKGIILIEVKSGNVNVKNVREFINVVDTVQAHLGLFVCFEDQVTKPMRLEPKNAGYFEPDTFGRQYERIQIITIEELLDGKYFRFPAYQNSTFKKAVKRVAKNGNPSIDMFE